MVGTSTLRWANVWSVLLNVANIANVGSLQVGGTTVIDSSRKLQNIASVATNLNPDADNTRALGSGSYRYAGVVAVTGYFDNLYHTDGTKYPLSDSAASESGLSISASTWTDLLSVNRTLGATKRALIIAEAYIYTSSYGAGYTWELRILVDGNQPTGAYQRQCVAGYLTHVAVSAVVDLATGSHTIKLQGWCSTSGTVYHRRLDVLYF